MKTDKNYIKFMTSANGIVARHIKNDEDLKGIFTITHNYDLCCSIIKFNRHVFKGIDATLYMRGLDQHTLWFYDAPQLDSDSIALFDTYFKRVKQELTKLGRTYNITINEIKYGTLSVPYLVALEMLIRKDVKYDINDDYRYINKATYGTDRIKEVQYDYSEREGMDLSYTETDTKIIHLVTTARRAYIEALKKKREDSIFNNPVFNSNLWEKATVNKINEVINHGKA